MKLTDLITIVRARTIHYLAQPAPTEPTFPDLDDDIVTVGKNIARGFGSHGEMADSMLKAFAATLGESYEDLKRVFDEMCKFIASKGESPLRGKVGICVVPLECNNSHNYPIGEPCVVTDGSTCLKMNGRFGNSLGMRELNKEFRFATPEEISLWEKAMAERWADNKSQLKTLKERIQQNPIISGIPNVNAVETDVEF